MKTQIVNVAYWVYAGKLPKRLWLSILYVVVASMVLAAQPIQAQQEQREPLEQDAEVFDMETFPDFPEEAEEITPQGVST